MYSNKFIFGKANMSHDLEKNIKSGGIGFFGLLTVLFIGLKLTNYINWAWYWVLGPLWIPTALTLSVAGTLFAIAGILYAFEDIACHIWEHIKKKK
jgi:hypothetical protein